MLGLVVIAAIFQVQEDRFLSAENLTNLMLQITTIGLISVGVVYVLLLGEIDLSVGAVSGLSAAVMAVLSAKHGWNAYLAIAAAIVNAFVHSRDAYAVVPTAQWLSLCTVVLMAIGRIVIAMQPVAGLEVRHD